MHSDLLAESGGILSHLNTECRKHKPGAKGIVHCHAGKTEHTVDDGRVLLRNFIRFIVVQTQSKTR